MNSRKPFEPPVVSEGVEFNHRQQNFSLTPLMGGGSGGGADGLFPGSGADGAQDSGGDGGATPDGGVD